MIYQLLGTLILSASVGLSPVPKQVVFDDNDLIITLTADEINNNTFENLFNWAFQYQDYLSSGLGLRYDNDFYYYSGYLEEMDGAVEGSVAFQHDIDNDGSYYQMFQMSNYNDYTFQLENQDAERLSIDNSVSFECAPDFAYYDSLKSAIQLDIGYSPEPEPVPPEPSNLYQIIYDFFYGIFNNQDLGSMSWTIGGQSIDMNAWICHTLTVILLVTLLIILLLITRWAFRVFAGLVK